MATIRVCGLHNPHRGGVVAFANADGSTVYVGSATLTAGGLSTNYEASVRVDDIDGALVADVAAHFDELIESEAVVLATKGRINDYAREFVVQKAWRDMAQRRADKINREAVRDLNVLASRTVSVTDWFFDGKIAENTPLPLGEIAIEDS